MANAFSCHRVTVLSLRIPAVDPEYSRAWLDRRQRRTTAGPVPLCGPTFTGEVPRREVPEMPSRSRSLRRSPHCHLLEFSFFRGIEQPALKIRLGKVESWCKGCKKGPVKSSPKIGVVQLPR